MRITINQSALGKHHERLGLLRLSAPTADRKAATIAHVAQLVIRLGLPLAKVAEISRSVADRAPAPDDAVCGQCVVRLALVRVGRSA